MLNKDNRVGLLLLFPALAILIALIAYPFAKTVSLSFFTQKIYQASGKWVGWNNYLNLLRAPGFWASFKLSLSWTFLNVFFQILLGVLISLLLHRQFRGRTLARGIALLPFFMPTVAMMLMWRWMLNDSYGIVNHVLKSLSIIQSNVGWLSTTQYAFGTVVAVSVWRYTPFVIINVLAKLQTIDVELYEAAELDGASKFQSFMHITLPGISDVLQVVTVLRVIFMFKKVDEIMLLTNGGPGTATTVLPLFTYKNTFESMQLGLGAASSILLMIIVFAMMVVYFRFVKEDES